MKNDWQNQAYLDLQLNAGWALKSRLFLAPWRLTKFHASFSALSTFGLHDVDLGRAPMIDPEIEKELHEIVKKPL